MLRRLVGMSLAFVTGFLALAAAAGAADEPKAADWSGWSPVGVWSGEVTKLDKGGKSFSLKTMMPLATGAGKPAAKTVSVMFADEGVVRWAKLPPKLNDKGKPVQRTDAELAAARKPAWAKGFAADRGELKPGHRVEVTLVRPKELAAKDVQFSDYRVKQVLIVGENPAPPDPPKGKAKN
jgi:hypothetical protein